MTTTAQNFSDDVWSLSERFVSCPIGIGAINQPPAAVGRKSIATTLDISTVLFVVDDPNPANGFTKSVADRVFIQNVSYNGKTPNVKHNPCGRATAGNGYEFSSLPPTAKQDLAILMLPSFSSDEFNPPSWMQMLNDLCRSSRYAIIISVEAEASLKDRENRAESIFGCLYFAAWEFTKAHLKLLRVRCDSDSAVSHDILSMIIQEEIQNETIALQPEVLYDLSKLNNHGKHSVDNLRAMRFLRKLFPMERSCFESGSCICTSHCSRIGTDAFQPHDSVLVTGGTGSLGLLTTRGLLHVNCKKIALVSRSGKVADADQNLFQEIMTLAHSKSAEVKIFCCDTSQMDSVRAMITNVMTDLRVPASGIAGVIHSAGVLKDGLIATRGAERGLDTVYNAKVKSCLNLSKALDGHDLKLFVCFSSIAACVGNAGQASYAFCNRALEAIMHERRTRGLPGFSVRFPGVIGAGMGRTIHASLHAMMASSNFVEHLMLRYLSHRPDFEALSETLTLIPQVMMEKIMETKLVHMYDTVDPVWVASISKSSARKLSPTSLALGGTIICEHFKRRKEQEMEKEVSVGVIDGVSSISSGSLCDSETEEPTNLATSIPSIEEIQRTIVDFAKLLVRGGRDPSKILHVSEGLMGQGMDSICAVELSHQLSTLYDVVLPKTLVMIHVSIERIAKFIHDELLEKAGHLRGSSAEMDGKAGNMGNNQRDSQQNLDDVCIIGVGMDFPQGIQSLESYWNLLYNRSATVDAAEVAAPSHLAHKLTMTEEPTCPHPLTITPESPYMKPLVNGKIALDAKLRQPPKVFDDLFLDDCFLRLSYAHRLHKEQWELLDPVLKKYFHISDGELQTMHPAQKLLLKNAYVALKDAGYEPRIAEKQLQRTVPQPSGTTPTALEPQAKQVPVNTGVYVGIGGRLDGLHQFMSPFVGDNVVHSMDSAVLARDATVYAATSHTLSVAAGRIAFAMGLEGPALAIDTACSSSLVALHHARRALQLHECDTALVVAANTLDNHTSMACSMAQMLSKSGSCRAFDTSADGYGRGEGCGALLLKRRQDCLRDGDRIYAVVRGSAVAQDGATASLTAPNASAQERVVKQALRDAQLTVDDVHLVEAHGTGTIYGDPIEVSALAKIFQPRSSQSGSPPVHITASKSNIGHLEAAAGMAGIFSALASLHYRHAPPIALLKTVNPLVQDTIGTTPLSLTQQLTALDATPGVHTAPLYAGISSFGYAGTIAHVVLESATAATGRALPNDRQMQTLLGADWVAPCNFTSRGINHVPASINFANKQVILADPTDIGKSAESAAVAAAVAVTVPRVDHVAAPHVCPWLRFPAARTLAWQFTGQGALVLNVARDLFDNNRIFQRYMGECDALLMEKLQVTASELLYPAAHVLNDPSLAAAAKERLTGDTRYAQSVLISLEICLALTLIEEARVLPSMVMGHSLGEYAAMVVAGHWTIAQALTIVCERSRIIANTPACSGVMHAIRGKEVEIQRYVDAQQRRGGGNAAVTAVSLAAINSDQSLVISGAESAVSQLIDTLKANKIVNMSMPLPVKNGFHSPVMKHAEEMFTHVLQPVVGTARKVHDMINPHNLSPKIRFFSTLCAREVSVAELCTANYWLQHMVQPVRYRDAILNLRDFGRALTIVEIGPQAILTRLATQVFQANPKMATEGIPSASNGGLFDEAKFGARFAAASLPSNLPSPLVPPVSIKDPTAPCKLMFCLD